MAGSFYLATGFRLLHYLAIAWLIGGTALMAATLRGARDPDDLPTQQAALALARRYEHTFWFAAALLVVSGIGNIGQLGDSALPRGTPWGDRFTLKLPLVLGFMLLGALRSFVLQPLPLPNARPEPVQDANAPTDSPHARIRALRWLYLATVALGALIFYQGWRLAYG